jgi:pimeloyl-ACP methyl ester carboxylesterase
MTDRRNPSRAGSWQDDFWWSNDGLRLHFRDYAGPADRPAILCLHGLSRNARDFEGVAARLAGNWRVVVPEMRGRGESAYARDPMTYVPLTYVQDIDALLTQLGLDRLVVIGTSMGGILAMLLAATQGERVVGALLNDIGPEISPAGLGRIRSYVGRQLWHPTWMHAARSLAEAHAETYPDYSIAEWLVMAKRLYRLNSSGRILLDYDMKIAEPFRVPGNEAGPDMWPALDALTGKPVTVVRGDRSDILSADVAERMVKRLPGAELVTVPNTGHAPTLEEPEAAAAVDRLLARFA